MTPVLAPAAPRPSAPRARAFPLVNGAVVLAFLVYGALWALAHRPLLLDTSKQNDDVQTNFIYFQRYTSAHALTGDPISKEMLPLVPLGIRGLYASLAASTGLYATSKVVQGICLLLLGAAAVLLAREDRANAGPAALLVFFFLHTPWIVYYLAGGNPRAFTFPCLALWGVGAITDRFPPRAAAALLAALTYPSAMAMALGGEGFLALSALLSDRRVETAKRLALRTAALVGGCALLVAPIAWPKPEIGRPFTMEEAMHEPAFWPGGRGAVLPLTPPLDAFADGLLSPFRPSGPPPLAGKRVPQDVWRFAAPLLFYVLPAALVVSRKAALPVASLSLGAACLVLYVLSRVFYLRLYHPSRYTMYGLRLTAILLFVEVLVRTPSRLARTGLAGGLLAALLLVGGSRFLPANGLTIDAKEHAALWAAVRGLPEDARIASHPMDGDGIPYWGARANMGSWETIQPWFTVLWQRQKTRAEDVLRALYATDRAELLAWCAKNRVTHLLLDPARYGADFREKARSFQPLSAYTDALLASVPRGSLVLAHLDEQAIVFRDPTFVLVDVAKLSAPAP